MADTGTRQERWAERETGRRMAAYRQALEEWQADDHELSHMISSARSYTGQPDTGASPIVLKKNERVFYFIPNVSLVEVQRAPGHFTGGYSGFSFRVTKGVRYNVGGSRGTYVQGAEQLKVTDEGALTVTDQRVVFTGSRNSREWAFSKLVSLEHDNSRPVTMLGVSNRQKISGVIYPAVNNGGFRFNLSLALSHYRDDVAGFVQSLEAERAQHAQARPVEPLPARPEEAPAGAAVILGAVKTIYTGKPTWKPRSRILTSIASGLVTLMVITGIADAGNGGHSAARPAASLSSITTETTPTPTSTADADAEAAAARAAARAQARAAARAAARQRAAERRREAARRAEARRRAAARAAARAEAQQEAAARAAAAAAAAAPTTHACTQTSSGSCIQGGEFCPQASYGTYGYDADGTRYKCTGDAVHPHWEGPM